MIKLGDSIEVEFVPERGGDEGWTDHWEVYQRLGKRRKLHGYAVSPEGAAMLVATLAATASQRGKAGQAIREWNEWLLELREILRTDGPGDPKKGTVSGQETTS